MGSSGYPLKPHVVMVPYPAQGHINPFMQLAKQMVAQGFTITFLNTDHNHHRILASAASSSSSSSKNLICEDIRLVHIPDGFPDNYDRMSDLGRLSEAIDRHMPAPFETLMLQLLHRSSNTNPNPNPNPNLVDNHDPNLNSPGNHSPKHCTNPTEPNPNPPVCIVSDVLMLFTQDIANKLGLPRVAVWLQSAASFAVNLHVPALIRDGYIPITEVSRKEPITSIPGHPPLDPYDLPSFFQTTSDASNYMFQFKLRPFERLQEAEFILINTFYDLEKDMLLSLQEEYRVLPAGPFLPPALLSVGGSRGDDDRTGTGLWAEDDGCLSWLDKQKDSSVLYISFGSIASLSQDQFRELVLGLDASKRPILWAIRPDIKELVSPLIPPSFLGGESKEESQVYITSWAPQALVLSHSSVGGFLTHCGWNSTLESISMGVPTLNWPYFADQMMNRKWMVDEWKVGKSFKASKDGMVTKEEVERLVRLLMEEEEGEEMRARARALSCLAKEAMQPHGSSCLNLHEVLKPYKHS